MGKHYCNIDFNDQHEHSELLIRRNAEYRLDSYGRLYEQTYYSINRRKIACIIGLILILIFFLAFLFCGYIVHAHYSFTAQETSESEVPDAEETSEPDECPTEAPTIYDRCSTEYISYADAWALYEQGGPDQLQFCINLMYARHGYAFEAGGKNDIYFSQQEWYQNLEKRKVPYKELNPYEQTNSDLLFGILEDEGYRQHEAASPN